MKLFTTQISWSEPWFFLWRIREAAGWRRLLFLALGISAVLLLILVGFGLGQAELWAKITGSLALGFVLTAALDLGNIQREVTVKDDSIFVNSTLSWGWEWDETFKFDDIQSIQLTRPAEWQRSYAGMLIFSKNDGFLVAVPNKVSLETLADILHRLGVKVLLSDWEPSPADKRFGVRDEADIDPAAVRGEITIDPVEPTEPKLNTAGHLAVQVLIALGPLLAALIGAIVAGVVLYRNWSELSVLDVSLSIAGAVFGIFVSLVYAMKIGQFLAASYAIRVGRRRLPGRSKALFEGREDDLVCVEVFDRESWTATIAQSADFGFLQIDPDKHRLLFEGNKSRWTLPLSALTACRIEEILVGTEATANPEKRYFVVLRSRHNGEPWEAGLLYIRTELGNDTPESRYQRARLLFLQFAETLGDEGHHLGR